MAYNIYIIMITVWIFVIVVLIIFYFIKKDEEENLQLKVEGFWDLTPYSYHWNIFKCLDGDCIRDESKKCYRWCDNWDEQGGADNCRMRCQDYADIMFDQYKFNNYTFDRILPRFEEHSLLNDIYSS